MDARLDFYNVIKEYTKNLTEDDAILLLSHNKKDGECINLLAGDYEMLSELFSVDGYVKLSESEKHIFNNTKKMILNIAYNICMTDSECKELMIKGLNKK